MDEFYIHIGTKFQIAESRPRNKTKIKVSISLLSITTEVLLAHLPKHSVQDPRLDASSPFKFDQGHIIQVQLQAELDASHTMIGEIFGHNRLRS